MIYVWVCQWCGKRGRTITAPHICPECGSGQDMIHIAKEN